MLESPLLRDHLSRMIKRLKKLLSSKSNKATQGKATQGPRRIAADSHGLHPGTISHGARDVVEKLSAAGYQAYVVGGCVRDALLGQHPKDFDVATDATPEQVKTVFRRARIIGRRFKIVHVRYGREIVEVTTFRAPHTGSTSRSPDAHKKPRKRAEHSQRSDAGMLLRDNVFGSLEEDAVRRDFTINALYYQPEENLLLDFVNGLDDIENQTLRMIGDPATRYREDPVRMLRAARFAAKLNFQMDAATLAPLRELHGLIEEVPAARLFDEVLKLLMKGDALSTYEILTEFQIFTHLFPDTARAMKDNDAYETFIRQALTNTDLRIQAKQHVTPAFLLGALLWPAVEVLRAQHIAAGMPPAVAFNKASAEIIRREVQHIAIPKRFSVPMREIWDLHLRLSNRGGNRALQLLELPRFRAAYDFVLLREQAGEDLGDLGDWWTTFQEADEDTRQQMSAAIKSGPRRKRRSGRKRSAQPTSP